jgi:hypothetical protein
MPLRFRNDNWEFGGAGAPFEERSAEPKSRRRRLATTLAFTTLFFAGASIAAVAGDQLSRYEAGDGPSAESTDTTTTTEAEAAAPATDEAAAPAATEAPATEAAATDAAAPEADANAAASTEPTLDDAAEAEALAAPSQSSAAEATGSTPAEAGTGAARPNAKKGARLRKAHMRTLLLPKLNPAPAPEIEGPADFATIWLNAQLPDPTPAASRLSPKFAANLKAAAQGGGVHWAVMLGVLRARGATGHAPADRTTLRKLAARLGSYGPARGDWARIVAYSGDSRFADKAAALARYDRAVGLKALVTGLESAKKTVATRLLSDPMVSIYAGGRDDIVTNRVDVRVLALIAYMRESFGQVTVSSLISGHRLYARPGVISAHIPGHAVDFSGLGGTPIQGHQEPGGITERAVREILLVPAEIMPRQVISLLGMGGPSFPMGDHYNHIHVGY